MIATPPPPPARLQVVAQEFSLALSRPRIRAGEAVIELVNGGQDAHDLRLERVGSSQADAWPVVQPGGHADLEVALRPGRYVLWCGLPGHRELGMQAVLVVTRPRRGGR